MSKKKLDPNDISGMVDELDQSGFFRQSPHTAQTSSTSLPSQIPQHVEEMHTDDTVIA
jgi:hypothetical protein